MAIICHFVWNKKNIENEANNFAKIFLGLHCISFYTFMQETFFLLLSYTSTFFHEATFINAKLLTYKYMHIYSHTLYAFIKKVKKSDKIVLLRWLVMIFLPLSSLVTAYSHHICMYVCEYFHKEYISCGQAVQGVPFHIMQIFKIFG